MTAVTVAVLRLGLMAPTKAIGAIVNTNIASNPPSPEWDQHRDSAARNRAPDRAEHVIPRSP